MKDEPWYSVKCIFEHSNRNVIEGMTVYEERIIVLLANDLDDAIARGEIEAREYASSLDNVRYVEFACAYHLYRRELIDQTEVYSIMRESDLDHDAFINHYYDDGSERTQ